MMPLPSLPTLRRCVLFLAASVTAQLALAADPELTNYKTGIDVTFGGVKGVAYMEEYFFYDKIVSDRKVVYIKSDTLISMSHNERNSVAQYNPGEHFRIIGANGLDGVANSGDEGVIRYKVDRDLNYRYWWSSPQTGKLLLPAYAGPFSFDSLEYETGVPVVGTVGPKPGVQVTDKANFYWRGYTDPFGDEWHILTVADDDATTGVAANTENYASDGKVYYFVVNPKTPALTVRASGAGQFYTTPPKAYFVPKVHAQTTYFQGSVTFELKALSGQNVFYRVNNAANGNNGAWLEAANPTLTESAFNNGANVLEYYYNASFKKSRVVVKNPAFPSAVESHGNLLWGTAENFERIKKRLGRVPYKNTWDNLQTNNDATRISYWDEQGMRGRRWPYYKFHPSAQSAALHNAFIAKVRGNEARRAGAAKTYAQYAKEMLMDHLRNVDPVGFEMDPNTTPIPSREVIGAGYYFVNAIFDGLGAYDLLISTYRSDQHASGITPIEDYFIRDIFAAYALESLQWQGNWNGLNPGMWGTAHDVGAIMAMVFMPTYSTPYFGTSGFDNATTTTYPYTPYPDDNYTWKQAFLDASTPRPGYPNRQYNFDPEGELWTADGQWQGKVSYFSSGLMGHVHHIFSNLNALHFPAKTYPLILTGYEHAINGTLYGTSNPSGLVKYTSMGVLNIRFPTLAAIGIPAARAVGETAEVRDAGIIGLLWYDDDAIKPAAPSNLRVGP